MSSNRLDEFDVDDGGQRPEAVQAAAAAVVSNVTWQCQLEKNMFN